jgi:hypothetical protein
MWLLLWAATAFAQSAPEMTPEEILKAQQDGTLYYRLYWAKIHPEMKASTCLDQQLKALHVEVARGRAEGRAALEKQEQLDVQKWKQANGQAGSPGQFYYAPSREQLPRPCGDYMYNRSQEMWRCWR